ncbi:MAG: secretin N-terminal domain-containing protein [Verrucomicrobiia bacterium]|jgi:general secretion pathway protein D
MKTTIITLFALAVTALPGVCQDRTLAPQRPAPDALKPTTTQAAVPATNEVANIKLNFQDTPLDTVLEYLATEAKFTIIKDADITGNIKAFSAKPLTREEAFDVINSLLYSKGFTAIRNKDILTVVNVADAKTRLIPVKRGAEPDMIPANDEMVTQILPVRYANASQLVQNLQPLLDENASITANEASNALLITDTQANIRRMAQIIQALDTSISGITSMRVYPLRNATATEAANVLNQVFNGQNSSTSGRGGNTGRGGTTGGGGSAADIMSRIRSRMSGGR